MNQKQNDTGRVLLITKEESRDCEFEKAFFMWNLEAVLEHNAKTGLQKAIREDFDAVIVEDFLTERSGYALAVEILRKKNILVYLLGNDKDDVSVIGAFRVGITDFFSIEASPAQLAVRCITAINRLQKDKARILNAEGRLCAYNMMLDTKNKVLEVGERKIELMKMEADILQVLMENPDSVLTKKEIYEKVWRSEYVDGDNSIAVHISKLRKKIEEDETTPRYIETRWGVGYRFISRPRKVSYC